jgi:hypothetical protein
MVATPCYGDVVNVDHARSTLRLALACRSRRVACEIVTLSGDSLVARARNALAAVFMASACSHLLFVDADGGFEPEDVFRLLAAAKDFVAGLPPRKTPELDFGVNWLGQPWRPERVDQVSGAVEIAGCGAAFTLISRRVFQAVAGVSPHLKCRGPDYLSWAEQEAHFAFFDCEVAEGGYWSEDLVFCRRWRACGGEVWAIPDMVLRHHGPRAFVGSLAERIAAVQGRCS